MEVVKSDLFYSNLIRQSLNRLVRLFKTSGKEFLVHSQVHQEICEDRA